MDQKLVKSKLAEGFIHITAIIEVVGKPKPHVEETLRSHVKEIKANASYIVLKESFEKAVKQENYFSAFAEIDLLAKDSPSVISFCFDYMPSSIEIVAPDKIMIDKNGLSGLLNDLQARLHSINSGLLELNEKNRFYVSNTAVLLRNFIVVLLSNMPMTEKELSPYLGVNEADIKKVLDVLIKEGKVKKIKDRYTVVPNEKA